jgi:DNA-3-methyladenine glycosylase I
MKPTLIRCPWPTDELYLGYHDTEWGVPAHDDRLLFELLILEGAQAGLSWHTVLKKRENYRAAFANFDAEKIARYGPKEIDALLNNAGIIRNRLKIHATIQNARAVLALRNEFGSLDAYVWRFVDGQPIVNRRRTMREVPARTAISDRLSKDLLKRGFKFVGSTICYAYMQATGMVNDHLVTCFRHEELSGAKP